MSGTISRAQLVRQLKKTLRTSSSSTERMAAQRSLVKLLEDESKSPVKSEAESETAATDIVDAASVRFYTEEAQAMMNGAYALRFWMLDILEAPTFLAHRNAWLAGSYNDGDVRVADGTAVPDLNALEAMIATRCTELKVNPQLLLRWCENSSRTRAEYELWESLPFELKLQTFRKE